MKYNCEQEEQKDGNESVRNAADDANTTNDK